MIILDVKTLVRRHSDISVVCHVCSFSYGNEYIYIYVCFSRQKPRRGLEAFCRGFRLLPPRFIRHEVLLLVSGNVRESRVTEKERTKKKNISPRSVVPVVESIATRILIAFIELRISTALYAINK